MTQSDSSYSHERFQDNRPIAITRGRLEAELERIIDMINRRRGDPAITFDVEEDLRYLLRLIRGE